MASDRLRLRHALFAGLLLGSLGMLGTAHAAGPTAADRESARALITEGNARRDKNDLKGALAAFEGADAIMHVPTTGLAVAYTRAALGLLVDARDMALEVSRSPVVAGEPRPFAQARKSAGDLAEELAPRIPTLRIVLQNAPPGAVPEITVADVPVPVAALVLPRKLNPGHHVIVGKVGAMMRRADVDLAEKEEKSVTLDFAEPTVAEAPWAPPAVDTKGTGEKPANASKRSPLVYAGFGAGGLGLIVGSVTGIMSITRASSATSSCVNFQCPPAVHADIDAARSLALVSTVGFIVAGVGAAVGVGALVLGNKAEQKKSALRATPYLGPTTAGITGEF